MTARVTIGLPVYNGERYVERALGSALAQDYDDFEILIHDNASTDRTGEICQDLAAGKSHVRYLRNENNIGAGPNFNLLIAQAQGAYAKWLAHDDYMSPNFISTAAAALDDAPDAALAFAPTQCVDQDDVFVPQRPGVQLGPILSDDPAERLYRTILTTGSNYPIFGLFRTDALKRSLGHQSYYGADRALTVEIALLGKLIEVENAILFNREHPQRSMNIGSKTSRRTWQALRTGRWANCVDLNQYRQFLQVARRHPDVCPPRRAVAAVARAALRLRQLGLFGIDAVRFFSPPAAGALKRSIDQLRGKSPPQAAPDAPARATGGAKGRLTS